MYFLIFFHFLATGTAFTPDAAHHIVVSQKLDDATHTTITQAGIKRAVCQYFLEKNPSYTSPLPSVLGGSVNLGLITLSVQLSLEDIFRIKYGALCLLNLTPYDLAVQEIALSNAATDSNDLKNRADFHFDAEKFTESNANVIAMLQAAKTAVANGKYSDARKAIGTALHTSQDFYAHSNWVEMGHTETNPGLGNNNGFGVPVAGPDTPTCKPCPNVCGDCENNLLVTDQLTSGYYLSALPPSSPETMADGSTVVKPPGKGKCSHGGEIDASANQDPIGGINKDTGDANASPHWQYHHQAADLAETTTVDFFNDLRNEIGDDQFENLLALKQPQCQNLLG